MKDLKAEKTTQDLKRERRKLIEKIIADEKSTIFSSIPFHQRPIENRIAYLAEIGSTFEEMAVEADLTLDELQEKYADLILLSQVRGHKNIRSSQYLSATHAKSDRMLMHLGKHMLRQIDELIVKEDISIDKQKKILSEMSREDLAKAIKDKLSLISTENK